VILNIIEKYYNKRTISVCSLLKETGYFETYNIINESDFFIEIKKNPKYIDQWLTWSESKRTKNGYYFQKNDKGKYIVGFLNSKENLIICSFSNIEKACAKFVKLEIEEIRKNSIIYLAHSRKK